MESEQQLGDSWQFFLAADEAFQIVAEELQVCRIRLGQHHYQFLEQNSRPLVDDLAHYFQQELLELCLSVSLQFSAMFLVD